MIWLLIFILIGLTFGPEMAIVAFMACILAVAVVQGFLVACAALGLAIEWVISRFDRYSS